MKIKIKVLLIVFTLLLISGSVTIIINQTVSKNIVEQEIYNGLENIAQSRAAHIETFLELKRKMVDQLSQSVGIQDLLLTAKNDEDYAKTFNAVTKRLKNTAKAEKNTRGIFVINKEGIIVASSEEIDIGKNKSGGPYFLGAEQGTFVKDAYLSQDRKINTLAFSAPVLDDNSEFLGVVVMRYSMEGLDKITTDRTGLGETGEIYLVNKDGYMITPSRFVNDTFLKQKINTETTWDLFRAIEIFEAPDHEAVLYKNYLGSEVLRVYVHIPEMVWYLVAEISEEEALVPIAELTRRMLSILALILVIGVVFSTVLSKMITDEIGHLSRAFDGMTTELNKSRAELEEHTRGLEEKVEERTNELAEKVKESKEQARSGKCKRDA
jgi:C4-dicarboxylate-specific signal transduction histidine kinase